MNDYIYYGWVDYQNQKYIVTKYPIINIMNTMFVTTYVIDTYLYIGDQQSTRYIESHLLDKDRQFNNGDKVGMITLDHRKAVEFVERKKKGRESYLLNELQKIKESTIEDCGE